MRTIIKRVALVLVMASIALVSCKKNDNPNSLNASEEGVLKLKIMANNLPISYNMVDYVSDGTTKSVGSSNENTANDLKIKTLEVFIFNSVTGNLDCYKKYTSSDNLSLIEIKTQVGSKVIYAIANSHKEDWNGIVSLDLFKKQVTSLKEENFGDFTMVGSTNATLSNSSTATLSIKRLISKIVLDEIKVSFNGTPYEGEVLSNVKAYLINVSGSKYYHDNSNVTPAQILNYKGFVPSDTLSAKMPRMLYENVASSIGTTAFSTPLYFYSYENLLAEETTDNRFTKLVIQGDLKGKTYYYPILINREGYGYVAANGHQGIQSNTVYRIKVTIKKTGSDSPDIVIQNGTFSITTTIEDWNNTESSDIEF